MDVMAQNRLSRANQNAERLHGAPSRLPINEQSSPLCCIPYYNMPNRRNKQNAKNATALVLSSKKQQSQYTAVRQASTYKPVNTATYRMPQYVKALLDPFAQEGHGVKVPDVNQMPSIATTVWGYGYIDADANGISAMMVTADPNDDNYLSGAATGSSWIWGGGGTTGWETIPTATNQAMVNFRANVSTYRNVAWGIKVSCPRSIAEAAGTVHVCLVPSDYGEAPGASMPTSIGGMKTMPGYMNVPVANLIQDSLVIPGRLMDEGAFRYRASGRPWFVHTTDPQLNLETSTGWSHILVVVEGAPASMFKILNVESVRHLEGVARPSTAAMTANITPAPYLPQVISAAMNMMRDIPYTRILDGSAATTMIGWWKTAEAAFQNASRIAAMPAARMLLTAL